jgi:hypothetical protein
MRLSAIISLLALLPAAWLSAIAADLPECTTDQLTNIASVLKLPVSGLDTLQVSYNDKPLSIGLNSRGCIDHIGYTIFTPDQRNILGKQIVDFIERYSLLADIPPRRNTVEKQMSEDGVILDGCKLNQLATTVGGADIALSVENLYGRTYKVVWNVAEGKKVTMTFPLSYDLLSGCDLDESERRLPEQIFDFQPDSTAVRIIPADMQVDPTTNLLVSQSETYFTNGLTSSRYFEEFEGEIDPLYSLDYPVETMANLLTDTDLNNEFEINIKLRCYNYQDVFMFLPLNRFVGYFLAQGCKPFFGVISADNGTIVGELVYVNRDLGYCHALKVTLNEKDLIERRGILQARMVSYIPVSRILNIFDDLN